MTAGYGDGDFVRSTEIQRTRDEEWEVIASAQYPVAVSGLKGGKVNGVIYMTGKT